jgi:hypothetical protein
MATLSGIITPTNVLTESSTATLTNKTINGDNNTVTNIDLAGDVKGTLPIANGGTGAATLTANNVLLGNGTSALQVVAPGTSGNVLTSNGTTWTSETFAAPAPTTNQVLTATADASLGAVGTYAFMSNNALMSMTPGGTQAASALRYSNADETALAGSPTPSGTWRRMGGNAGAYAAARGTLYLRIS